MKSARRRKRRERRLLKLIICSFKLGKRKELLGGCYRSKILSSNLSNYAFNCYY
jgi:hypothetical protein